MPTNNIRKYREAANMSLKDLGDKVGVSAQAIHRYETGTADPTVTILKKIAQALGCKMDDLV